MVTKENTLLNAFEFNSSSKFGVIFKKYFHETYSGQESIIFLCIGTDKCTGDSLGPLVGDELRLLYNNNVFVYGTLENPVHAQNLVTTIEYINEIHSNPYIIAIDACLGKIDHVGFIEVGTGGITPGTAVKKDLPEVGHMYVTGIVNISGFLEAIVLQNTRLYNVMTLANVITQGIRLAM